MIIYMPKRHTCPCGEVATDTIALASNIHQWHCGTCATQWDLVRSAISAIEDRHWTIKDYRAWVDGKMRAA